ncbi:hypothetical protein KIPB_007783 [Kipferlia bialata]|uniref:Uncharacterized protein n=1 Tax=Kipferlia bialata TaxID=797122 RepID=A0A9K3CZ41_9EUKA|nr:hypothetical protein KIPB_007783 [Kipferlia bialata]|eukprot:g7783.t1
MARVHVSGMHDRRVTCFASLPLLMILAPAFILVGTLSSFAPKHYLSGLPSTSSLLEYEDDILTVFRVLPMALAAGMGVMVAGRGDKKGNKSSFWVSIVFSVLAASLPVAEFAAGLSSSLGGEEAPLYLLAASQVLASIAVAYSLPSAVGYLWRYSGPSNRLAAMTFVGFFLGLLSVAPSLCASLYLNGEVDTTVPDELNDDNAYLVPSLLALPLALVAVLFNCITRRPECEFCMVSQPGKCNCANVEHNMKKKEGGRRFADFLTGLGITLLALCACTVYVLYDVVEVKGETVAMPLGLTYWQAGLAVGAAGVALILITAPSRCTKKVAKSVESYPGFSRYVVVAFGLGLVAAVGTLLAEVTPEYILEADTLTTYLSYSEVGYFLLPFVMAGVLGMVLVFPLSCLASSSHSLPHWLMGLSVVCSVAIGFGYELLFPYLPSPLLMVAVVNVPAGLVILVTVLVCVRMTRSFAAGLRGPKSRPWTAKTTLGAAYFVGAFLVGYVTLNPMSNPAEQVQTVLVSLGADLGASPTRTIAEWTVGVFAVLGLCGAATLSWLGVYDNGDKAMVTLVDLEAQRTKRHNAKRAQRGQMVQPSNQVIMQQVPQQQIQMQPMIQPMMVMPQQQQVIMSPVIYPGNQ